MFNLPGSNNSSQSRLISMSLLILTIFGFLVVAAFFTADKLAKKANSTKIVAGPDGNSSGSSLQGGKPSMGQEIFYEGKIVYVDPVFYPDDKISYILTDKVGKELYLLRAYDEKLIVAEGHIVRVYGRLAKTNDNKKDVILVDKVVIVNAEK